MAMRFGAEKLILAACLLLSLLGNSGCSAVTIDNDSPPEAQYAEGERLLEKDRYLEAVERFRILKSRYPYSKYAALATLRIGDAHFKEEAFLEAASAYKIFRDLYPRHEQAAYALFRTGESYYNTLPGTIDRDLEPALAAIDAYSLLLKESPGSPYQKDAEAKIKDLREKLAEKEAYVGDYYFKREQYQAAATRYAYLLQNYPEAGRNEETVYRLAYSFERMGEYRKAEQALDIMGQQFPNGSKQSDAKNLREKVNAGLEKSQ
jgi:outer membrane protein assembly factor BamD